MFIFSQFNFPDPKPRVSEGDWRSLETWGPGAAVAQKQSRKQGKDHPGEERERSMNQKGALGPEWRAGVSLYHRSRVTLS